MIDQLKERFGYKCSGIKLNADTEDVFINNPLKKLSFCEALYYSFNVPLMLHKDNISGVGIFSILGFMQDKDLMAKEISSHKDLTRSLINDILSKFPTITKPIENVVMGITEEYEQIMTPDMYIIASRSKELLKYIRLCVNQNTISINPDMILSVCGTFARCFSENRPVVHIGRSGLAKVEKFIDEGVILAIPSREIEHIDISL